MFDLGLVPHREFARKLINQGMIQGRSNFVFRARERFYEQYLKIKVLQPFFAEMGVMEVAQKDHHEGEMYDFAFAENDLVIEVVSKKQVEKVERIRRAAVSDGKRLLVLFTEVLAGLVNEPETTAAVIRKALGSRETYFDNDCPHCSEQLFISHNLTQKYDNECFTKLHVDVNIVENDVLDTEAARKKPMFENANFKLDADGKFTCSFEVEKMSKSKFNVVNPDDMVSQYGADCFRMFEMFLGPIEDAKPWNTAGISGVANFLRKFWGLFFDEKGNFSVSDEPASRDELRVLHTAIKKITEDVERFSMNTCVSHFMIATNDLRKLNSSKRAVLQALTTMLAPFAPHVSEELWHRLSHQTTVCDASWPELVEEFLKTDAVNYPVQINGKHRGNIEIPNGLSNAGIEKMVMAEEFVQRNLAGASVKKFIVVPGRIVNIVI